MSVLLQGKVWLSDLPKHKKMIALAYADHADDDGHNIFPSAAYVSWKTGYSIRHVRRVTDELENDRILVHVGSGWGGTKRYQMLAGNLPPRDPFRPPESEEEIPDMGVTGCQGGDIHDKKVSSMSPDPSVNQKNNNRPIPKYPGYGPNVGMDADGNPDFEEDVFEEMRTAISKVCMGKCNFLDPDDKITQATTVLLTDGHTPEQVRGFANWWKENGDYSGLPWPKSLLQHFDQYLNDTEFGTVLAPVSGVLQAGEGWKEVNLWLTRRLAGADLTPETRTTIGRIGESIFRSMGANNREAVRQRFYDTYLVVWRQRNEQTST